MFSRNQPVKYLERFRPETKDDIYLFNILKILNLQKKNFNLTYALIYLFLIYND